MTKFDLGTVDIRYLRNTFERARPFPYLVIDDFFSHRDAESLSADFPDVNSSLWYEYNNAIEKKSVLNHWDRFPAKTYSIFSYLNSPSFIKKVELISGVTPLFPDVGLHGGGWHMHQSGGKLNVHLDYSIHPKLKLERALNLTVYLTPDWDPKWGGGLGLWTHDFEKQRPLQMEVEVECKFNRAVIFDTRKNSWHGLPDPLACPENITRKSIAVYYLTNPQSYAVDREKALFAPYKEQGEDPEVLELIKNRSLVSTADSVYKKS